MPKADTYNYEEIQRYLQHKMDAKEMHAFERAMMDDPFLADAIEGYRKSNEAIAANHLKEIERQLTANKQQAKVVPLPLHKTAWWKVAAIVLIIVFGGALSYVLFNNPVTDKNTTPQIAQTESKEIPVEKDSIGPAEKSIQFDKASDNQALAYRKNTSPVIRKNAKAPPSLVKTPHPIQDTTMLATADKMDERALTANETASPKTTLTPQPRKVTTFSASAEPKELKGAATTDAQIKSEAFAKKNIAKKDTNVLSEVAVVGYKTKPKRDITGSVTTINTKEQSGEPEGGWKNFDNYVKREIQSFKDSTDTANNIAITLEFSIDEKGHPADIQIKEDADKAVEDKAIQILKNGPLWRRNKDQSKVKITMAF